ncbi:MAG TPA: glycosyltransferase family 39 protein [Abditibacteriaceae bacterium]|nr:glycosyltransferase family 39 protein [Abditibacteriaceae bacterium]
MPRFVTCAVSRHSFQLSSTRLNFFSSHRFSPRLVLVLCATLLLWNLGYATFWNPDEGRYAASSLEMARGFEGQSPDWVVPHLNTISRLNKPPLVYWLGATFYNMFGAHEWSGRLGSAFFAIGTMLLVWQIARLVWSERVGLFAAMIWTTSLLPFGMARTLNTDMLLCGAITLAMYGLWRAIEYSFRDDATPRFDFAAFIIAGLGMGLALLAKGPVGLVLPLASAFFYLLVARRWPVLRSSRIWLGIVLSLLLAIAMAMPWYLAVHARDPLFLSHFLGTENVGRFAGGKNFHNETPFYYYVPVVLLGMLPWTPLLVATAIFRPRGTADLQNRTLIFAWMWAAFIIVLFSASSTKLISYVLPAFPALAILCAVALNRVLETRPRRSFVPATAWGTNALLLALCAYLTLSGTVVTSDIGAPYLAMVVVVLAAGSWWVWREWQGAGTSRPVFAHFATWCALFAVLLSFAGQAARFEDSSGMIARLKPHLEPEQKLIQTMFQPTSIFYTARPVVTIGFRNSSGLSNEEIRRSPLFWLSEPEVEPNAPQSPAQQRKSAQALARVLDSAGRAFILVRRREYAATMANVRPLLRTQTFVIGRTNDYLILSNRPAPQGYSFEYVTPKNRDKEQISVQKPAPRS